VGVGITNNYTAIIIKTIREDLVKQPDGIHWIDGLGNQCIALASTKVGEEYDPFMDFKLEGVLYTIYQKRRS